VACKLIRRCGAAAAAAWWSRTPHACRQLALVKFAAETLSFVLNTISHQQQCTGMLCSCLSCEQHQYCRCLARSDDIKAFVVNVRTHLNSHWAPSQPARLLKPPTHTLNLPSMAMLPVGSTGLQEKPVPAASGVNMKLSSQAMSQRPDRQRGLPLSGVGHWAAVVQPAGRDAAGRV
jgi:hypothetical protein